MFKRVQVGVYEFHFIRRFTNPSVAAEFAETNHWSACCFLAFLRWWSLLLRPPDCWLPHRGLTLRFSRPLSRKAFLGAGKASLFFPMLDGMYVSAQALFSRGVPSWLRSQSGLLNAVQPVLAVGGRIRFVDGGGEFPIADGQIRPVTGIGSVIGSGSSGIRGVRPVGTGPTNIGSRRPHTPRCIRRRAPGIGRRGRGCTVWSAAESPWRCRG